MKNKKITTKDIVYIGFSAAVIAVCSFITVPVGAVPITLQTLGVCLVSGIIGLKRGTLSVLVYILIGAIGLPVFSGFRGGLGVLAGATGGYIIGFIFTALIIGFVTEKTEKPWALVLSMIMGIAVCYAFGTLWFMLVYSKDSAALPLSKTLAVCVTPFIIPDLIKITISAFLVYRLKDKILKQTDK